MLRSRNNFIIRPNTRSRNPEFPTLLVSELTLLFFHSTPEDASQRRRKRDSSLDDGRSTKLRSQHASTTSFNLPWQSPRDSRQIQCHIIQALPQTVMPIEIAKEPKRQCNTTKSKLPKVKPKLDSTRASLLWIFGGQEKHGQREDRQCCLVFVRCRSPLNCNFAMHALAANRRKCSEGWEEQFTDLANR